MQNYPIFTVAILGGTATHVALDVVIFYFLVHLWRRSSAPAWTLPLPPKMRPSRLYVIGNVIRVIGSLLLFLFLFACAINWAINQTEEMAWGTGLLLGIFCILYMVYPLVNLIHANATCGSVLLDLGPLPGARFFCLIAGYFAFTGISTALFVSVAGFIGSNSGIMRVEGRPSLSEAMLLSGFMFLITDFVAIGMAALASGRLQLRENGILIGTRLLKWNRVSSFKWESESWLLVNVKTRFPSRGKKMFPVPSEHKTLAEKILLSHCTLEKDS